LIPSRRVVIEGITAACKMNIHGYVLPIYRAYPLPFTLATDEDVEEESIQIQFFHAICYV
jgi:hypothetical protein